MSKLVLMLITSLAFSQEIRFNIKEADLNGTLVKNIRVCLDTDTQKYRMWNREKNLNNYILMNCGINKFCLKEIK